MRPTITILICLLSTQLAFAGNDLLGEVGPKRSVKEDNSLLSMDPAFRLVSQSTHDLFMQFWPKSEDPYLDELRARGPVFYDDFSMPTAHQDWDSTDGKGLNLHGVHTPTYNISSMRDRGEPYGNANREFPWGDPAGLQERPTNAKSLRFAVFPVGKKIKWWREKLPRDIGYSYVWEYPNGTTFGELLLVTDSRGMDHTFEVRTRTRRGRGDWTITVHRPFGTREEYVGALSDLGVEYKPSSFQVMKLRNNHAVEIFNVTGLQHFLSPLPEGVVVKLLHRPFRDVSLVPWVEHEGRQAWAPTVESGFHIVPVNYRAGLIETSAQSCMRCHTTTLKHAEDFDVARDWYGRVRGSDNIFSFHIFDRTSVAQNGDPLPVKLNPLIPLEFDASRSALPAPPEVTESREDKTALRRLLQRIRTAVRAKGSSPMMMYAGGYGMETRTESYSSSSFSSSSYSAPVMRSFSVPMMMRTEPMYSSHMLVSSPMRVESFSAPVRVEMRAAPPPVMRRSVPVMRSVPMARARGC